MITFDRLSYQNFLSTGNAPIEVDFTAHDTVLVVGKNGAGKSTMNEALCYALFGKPLRNINKPKLINSINNRDCLVELDLHTSAGKYRIRRGMKPTVFEIYENGTLIKSPASALDYQEILETQILKLNYKSFQQVVVLGNASYTPFMRLGAAARREIIEDLLDIEVFGSMNALTKDDANDLKAEIEKVSQASKLIGNQLTMAREFTEQLAEQRQEAVARVDATIAAEKQALEDLRTEREALEQDIAQYEDASDVLDAANKKVKKYENIQRKISDTLNQLTRDRSFYDSHDSCPTCEQPITHESKEARYQAIDQKEQDAQKAAAQCSKLLARYQGEVDAARKRVGESERIQRGIAAIDAKIGVHQKRITDLGAERLKAAQPPKKAPAVDVDDLEKQLETLQEQQADLSKKRVIVDAANMLLKDSGIKARVIRHYLPIINKTINSYLTAMDFPILFTLDEEFEEHIKSRYRDEFAYESFSEGEKKRIDLALLLTWRAIARMKNSAATNLLVLDEVFDGSLDIAGTEDFLKIIRGLEKDTHVYVISHKTDQLIDKFSHVMLFEKQRGFSLVKS